ncbi:MAG: hypothetical protein M3P40_03685 [Actinomycetota bacterium]|nr:hypothetical protein [Actinomycetota bacterium]
MLFDLQSPGRRRVVKLVYITLAVLMGGGLILFNIGGEQGGGGLADAFRESQTRGGDGTERFLQREQAALKATRTRPREPEAYAALARTRFQLASVGDNFDPQQREYTAAGRQELRQATEAWEKHAELTKKPDTRVATLMAQAYIELGEPAAAARAQEYVTEDRNDAGSFAQLAAFAYAAGQARRGDLAAARAVELSDPEQRSGLRQQLEQLKQQGAGTGVPATPEGGR